MQDTLPTVLADLSSAIATVERLPIADLPGLVGARLLIAVEESRVVLARARDAALALMPAEANAGSLFRG